LRDPGKLPGRGHSLPAGYDIEIRDRSFEQEVSDTPAHEIERKTG
jgi:hypothetical protein